MLSSYPAKRKKPQSLSGLGLFCDRRGVYFVGRQVRLTPEAPLPK